MVRYFVIFGCCFLIKILFGAPLGPKCSQKSSKWRQNGVPKTLWRSTCSAFGTNWCPRGRPKRPKAVFVMVFVNVWNLPSLIFDDFPMHFGIGQIMPVPCFKVVGSYCQRPKVSAVAPTLQCTQNRPGGAKKYPARSTRSAPGADCCPRGRPKRTKASFL